MGTSGSFSIPPHPDKAVYVFADGTNILKELRQLKLRLNKLIPIFQPASSRQYLQKVFLYTTSEQEATALSNHSQNVFDGIRVIHGLSIVGENGKVKREKGVDAQLVADMIYHAASRNASHIVLVSNDADFSFALRRVEDFGCTTEVIWVGQKPCKALIEAADAIRVVCVPELKANCGAVDV